jgi:molecular chaperone GrpE
MMKDKRKKTATEVTAEAAAAQGGADGVCPVPAEGQEPGTEAGPGVDGEAAAVRRVAEVEDRLLRLQADFDNYRKRMAREREELWRQAHGDVIGELLHVIDHLDLALASAADHQAPAVFVDGFRMVRDQFMASLQKYGLKAVDAEGHPFNPLVHEAVAHLPSDAVAENHVLVQTRRGFMLGDRLLRPAQVVVSKGSLGEPAAGSPSEPGAGAPSAAGVSETKQGA